MSRLSPWLTDDVEYDLVPIEVLSFREARDKAAAVMELFGVPTELDGENGLRFPDPRAAERHGHLTHTLLKLLELRFPLEGSPRAAALAEAQTEDDQRPSES